jgi:tRNA threonylcarbamoyladenosine biosynthesis protein TsaB
MDTSTGPSSVAVWKAGHVAAYMENSKPTMQSATLMPMVEDVMAKAGVSYQQLSAVAATIGPGSFTGIRVALAAARAICLAAGIPAMGYTSLQVLAFAARRQEAVTLAVLNAGKGEHYYQYYKNNPWEEAGEASLGVLSKAMDELPAASAVFAGNAVIDDTRFISANIPFPHADALAELAANFPQLAQPVLHPFYIRAPDAKLPQPKTNP